MVEPVVPLRARVSEGSEVLGGLGKGHLVTRITMKRNDKKREYI